jgi:LysR family transcriptional regulator, transcriptional activator of the cysJI operon
LQQIRDVISGNIRIATIYSIGFHDLQSCLKKYLKAYPTVNVHVEYRRAYEVYQDVLGNVVDLGLVAYPVKDGKIDTIFLRKERLVLICHPHHLLAKQKHARLRSLCGQRFIGFEPDLPTSKAIDNLLKEHAVQVQNVMNFDNIETVKRAVEIDAGVSIVPEGTITQEVENQTLARLDIEDGEFHRPLGAILKKNKAISPALKELLTALRSE